MKNLDTFPVMKDGKFFGYADAQQIASNSNLELYDERKAEALKAEAAVAAAKEDAAKKDASVENAKKAGGADASAVKKGPSA